MVSPYQIPFNELSEAELHDFHYRLKTEKERRLMARLDAIYTELLELAEDGNTTPEELILKMPCAKRLQVSLRSEKKIKYRNPAVPSETWTGRGKRPNWLNAMLANGKSLETFLVKE